MSAWDEPVVPEYLTKLDKELPIPQSCRLENGPTLFYKQQLRDKLYVEVGIASNTGCNVKVVESRALNCVNLPEADPIEIPQEIKINLSAIQQEAVVYAVNKLNQKLPCKDGKKAKTAGFWLGHKAGLGKTRSCLAVLWMFWGKNIRKHIYLSTSMNLRNDLVQELQELLGARHDSLPMQIKTLECFRNQPKETLRDFTGIIFIPYNHLRAKSVLLKEGRSKKHTLQIHDLMYWMGPRDEYEGVLVVDECHTIKNAIHKQKSRISATGNLILEFQNFFINARILYVSATACSEPSNFGVLDRLGLYGEGTCYKDFNEFHQVLDCTNNLSAYSLITLDLKRKGAMVSSSLSYDNVEFQVVETTLNAQDQKDFNKLYDECVFLWVDLGDEMKRLIKIYQSEENASILKTVKASFWFSHQIFFRSLILYQKLNTIVKETSKHVHNNCAVVIGLQGIGERAYDDVVFATDIKEQTASKRKPLDEVSPANKMSKLSVSDRTNDENGTSTNKDNAANNENCSLEDEIAETPSNANARGVFPAGNLLNEGKDCFEDQPIRDNCEFESDKFMSYARAILSNMVCKIYDALTGKLKTKAPRQMAPTNTWDSTEEDDFTDEDSTSEESDCEDRESSISSSNELDGPGKLFDLSGDDDSNLPRSAQTIMGNSSRQSHTLADLPSMNVEQYFPDKALHDAENIPDHTDTQSTEKSIEYEAAKKKELDGFKQCYINRVNELKYDLPMNFIDQLTHKIKEECGQDNVAEMTGRKFKITCTKGSNGKDQFSVERRSTDVNEERQQFLDGHKDVIIISDVGSTGISLHAKPTRVNKTPKRRVHITVELGWSADRIIQQLGRSHRASQNSLPKYVFVVSSIPAERRFISEPIERIKSLGAITSAEKQNDIVSVLEKFDIKNEWGQKAFRDVLFFLSHDKASPPPGDNIPDITKITHEFAKLKLIVDYENEEDDDDNINQEKSKRKSRKRVTKSKHIIKNVLNKLLGCSLSTQETFLDLFDRYYEKNKLEKTFEVSGTIGITNEVTLDLMDIKHIQPSSFKAASLELLYLRVNIGTSIDVVQNMLNNADELDQLSGIYTEKDPVGSLNWLYFYLENIRIPNEHTLTIKKCLNYSNPELNGAVCRLHQPHLPPREMWLMDVRRFCLKNQMMFPRSGLPSYGTQATTLAETCIHKYLNLECKRASCPIQGNCSSTTVLTGDLVAVWKDLVSVVRKKEDFPIIIGRLQDPAGLGLPSQYYAKQFIGIDIPPRDLKDLLNLWNRQPVTPKSSSSSTGTESANFESLDPEESQMETE